MEAVVVRRRRHHHRRGSVRGSVDELRLAEHRTGAVQDLWLHALAGQWVPYLIPAQKPWLTFTGWFSDFLSYVFGKKPLPVANVFVCHHIWNLWNMQKSQWVDGAQRSRLREIRKMMKSTVILQLWACKASPRRFYFDHTSQCVLTLLSLSNPLFNSKDPGKKKLTLRLSSSKWAVLLISHQLLWLSISSREKQKGKNVPEHLAAVNSEAVNPVKSFSSIKNSKA